MEGRLESRKTRVEEGNLFVSIGDKRRVGVVGREIGPSGGTGSILAGEKPTQTHAPSSGFQFGLTLDSTCDIWPIAAWMCFINIDISREQTSAEHYSFLQGT